MPEAGLGVVPWKVSREAIEYEAFGPSHLVGAVALCERLGWPSYADAAVACTAFSAPGTVTWVALCKGEVVGLVHLLSNGVVHAHLSLVGLFPTTGATASLVS